MNFRSALVSTCVVLLLAAATACGNALGDKPMKGGPVDTGAGSLTAARKYLEGRWTLESFEVFPPGKPPMLLKGQGTLTYDNFGNLEMNIRTDEATADLLRAAGIEMRENSISTSGRTAVDMQNRTLTYILGGKQPTNAPLGPLAVNRPRYWEVDANTLTLTTKDDSGKPSSIGRWKRMP